MIYHCYTSYMRLCVVRAGRVLHWKTSSASAGRQLCEPAFYSGQVLQVILDDTYQMHQTHLLSFKMLQQTITVYWKPTSVTKIQLKVVMPLQGSI